MFFKTPNGMNKTSYGICGVLLAIFVLLYLFLYGFLFENVSFATLYGILTNSTFFLKTLSSKAEMNTSAKSINTLGLTNITKAPLTSNYSLQSGNKSVKNELRNRIKLIYTTMQTISAKKLPNVSKMSTFKMNKDREFHKKQFTTTTKNVRQGNSSIDESKKLLTTETTPAEINENFRNMHFMTISGLGRLGNKMYQFASLLGTASRHFYTPYITSSHALNKIFDIPQKKDIHVTNVKGFGEISAGIYDKNIEQLSHKFNWTLQGYYQSWKYFHHIKEDIKRSFKFKQTFLQYAKNLLQKVNPNKRPTVGVHIRRRDMASRRELSRGYSVATVKFINNAMKYFRNNVSDPLFIIVSDDHGWGKQHFKDDDVIHSPPGSPGGDMALLANCNNSIVSTGTYGWWGAWLAGGQVVYFRDFPTPGSWLSTRYNKTDYYPPHWIGML